MNIATEFAGWALPAAAIAGFSAVALGAFGAHGLKNVLSSDMMDVYQTGVLYHLVHATVLFALALLLTRVSSSSLQLAAVCMTLGIVLFSGSLYALAISGIRWLGAITPIGGTFFLIGWVLIFVASFRWPTLNT